MSPTIRSKGGLPLFVGGQVAGSQTCCCENPPPPVCVCDDGCQYIAQVISPGSLAVSSGPSAYCGAQAFNQVVIDGMLQSIFPVSNQNSWLAGDNKSSASASNYTYLNNSFLFNNRGVSLVHSVVGYPEFEHPETEADIFSCFINDDLVFSALSYITSAVYCQGEKYFALIEIRVQVIYEYYNPNCGRPELGRKVKQRIGFFELPSSCNVIESQDCQYNGRGKVRLNTPLEFTINGDGTSTFGNVPVFQSYGTSRPEVESFVNEKFDQLESFLTGTFRITSRPNCKPPVACDCNHVDLRGLIIDFAGRSFEIGKYVDEEVDGVRFVSGQNPSGYTVIRETRAGGFPQDTTQIDMICTESGGWMVLMSTRCRRRVDGQLVSDTTDQWAGVMQCSESCDGFYEAASEPGLFQVRTAGEPIPLGEAQDVEYLGRESSAVECEPPARSTFSIRQVEFC